MDPEDQTLNKHGVELKRISGSIDQADHQKIKTILLIDLPFKHFFFGKMFRPNKSNSLIKKIICRFILNKVICCSPTLDDLVWSTCST